MHLLKFSIVTPSLNQAEFLEKTILSVLDQNYDHFEHIIIDGGSVDGTLEVLKKYDHLKWVSEKDNGQSNAINKGFSMADGEIIGWLNSDDVYRPGAFHKAKTFFLEHADVDFIFSNCLIIDEKDQIIGYLPGKDPQLFPVMTNRNFIPQPTVFFRKQVLTVTGLLDERYHMSMDFDYWRRISKSHKMVYVDDIFSCFREHRNSKTTTNQPMFKRESKESFFKNGGSIFSPYYYETFIRPKLWALISNNYIVRRLFYQKA